MPLPEDARSAGAEAIATLRRRMESKVAELIRQDPEWAANATEVGLIDKDWLNAPDQHPVRKASTLDMVQRLLERSVEQRPSALSSLGLSAVQMLAVDRDIEGSDPAPSPVAVMFTDLEAFTRYTADHGDDAAITILQDLHRAVGPIVRSRGGRVVKRLGDGLMLAFPAPEAAALASLELLEVAPDPLRLRAGVHFGDAVVTHDDVVGHVVNVAARVTEAAKGGQVLVTSALCEAVGELPGLSYSRPKRTRLKGVPEPISVCRLRRA